MSDPPVEKTGPDEPETTPGPDAAANRPLCAKDVPALVEKEVG